ncbi:MAG: LysE family translocator [Betaproteobacteria bacterium]
MIPLDALALFALACVVLMLTPGPNLMYLISRTLCQGRAAGMISLAGTTTGFLCYAVAAALGLTAVLVAIPMLYDAVRWAGAAYLLWLAWDAVRPRGAGGLFTRRDLPPARPAVLFRTGMLTSILNPKVALFYLALFPQFVDPSRGSVLLQSLLLAAVQIVIGGVGDMLFVLAAAHAARWLGARRMWIAVQRWVLGGIFAGIAVKLALDARAR